MSRSNNTEIKNPAKRFFEWAGGKGIIRYWDKEAGDKGENVEVPLPFSFLVLDRLSCISGFSESDNSGYWSNEVRDTRTDKLTVRTKKGIVAEGLYSTFDKIKSKGAQYAQSVYIAYLEEGKLTIGNIKLSGSAIGSWIEFLKKNDVYTAAVVIKDKVGKVKGSTHYFEPVFALKAVSPESEAAAKELDKELQEYLASYFKRSFDTTPAPSDVVSEKQKEDIATLSHPEDKGSQGDQQNTTSEEQNPGGSPDDDLPF